MIIQRTLLWFTLDKYLGTLLSLTAVLLVFMNFCITDSFKILMISIFQYLADSFRFQEFPSVLRSTDYLIDNKQIGFNCFFRILPSKSPSPSYVRSIYVLCLRGWWMSLKFVTNKFHINCFCINPSDEMTSMNGIALRSKFNLLSIWYSLPYNTHFWQFLWSW